MPFKELLGTLIENVPGALGAIIADWEGESVDQVSYIDDYEIKILGAHKGVILANMRRALCEKAADDLQEVVITTEKNQTLILPINNEYFLVLTLERGDALGRARLEARRCVAKLKEDID